MSTPSSPPAERDAPEAAAAAPKTAAVVYNPIKVSLADIKKSVRRHQNKAGWNETLYYATSIEDPGGGVTRQAVEAGADVVIAAGGDGTVRNVAEALRGSTTALGLLPSGTGNLLARNLKLSLDHLDNAISTVFHGVERKIDLGVVDIENPDGTRDRSVFVVMAGLGLDAQMLANTNDTLKKRIGWLAYVDAIARSLRDNNSMNIRYDLDHSGRKSMKTHTIILGNCGLLPGNLMLLPDAAIDDGVFDIVALRPERKIDWVGIWLKIVWENGILRRSRAGRQVMRLAPDLKTVRYMKGSEIVVRLESPQDFELDGDSHGMAVAIRAWVDPLALRVRVPA
ncbi:diacylglycerol kinase family enzyme [Frondihabitans sp. PhB188]|uniref:diacylglycerol/lipid kinase family protein n=1 Tax=Frondihabitans sp. PhB188 TaxID=2485200 RepID=UPI000F4A368D|nr:diacylglycerol kinase family protein [Frondihabitans sp. PhB188]ROQ39814.1 diacylglycerol kinase family enzyme [Frondihabitans sp. PhB188]